MGWLIGSVVAFLFAMLLVVALARPVTARWERARYAPRHRAHRRSPRGPV